MSHDAACDSQPVTYDYFLFNNTIPALYSAWETNIGLDDCRIVKLHEAIHSEFGEACG